MAAKTKINDHGDVIFSEEDVIELIYTDPDFDISKLKFDDPTKYLDSLKQLGIDLPVINSVPSRPSIEEFDKENCENWYMPDKYYQINVLQWLLDKCQSEEEKIRVQLEYDLFEKKNGAWVSLDGVACKTREHCQIAQWLYLAGIRYSIYRPLPVDECQLSDFYLPEGGVCLEYWGAGEHSDAISARMRRAELCKELNLSVLDIHPEDMSVLDDYLSRHLQQLGVDFY